MAQGDGARGRLRAALGGAAARRVRRDGWTAARRRVFLEALADSGNVRRAAEVAAKSRTSAYMLRHADPEFAREWEQALDRAYDELEAVALDRAINGVKKTVLRGGEPYVITDYPDRVLLHMLGRRPPRGHAPGFDAAAGERHERELCLRVETRLREAERAAGIGGIGGGMDGDDA